MTGTRWAASVVMIVLTAGGVRAQGPVRVQNRLLEKEHRLFVTAGAVYLDRADYFASPGAAISVSFYPREQDALELFAAGFVSFSSPGAQEVFDRAGLVPEANRPQLLLMGGGRHSLGYGKVLLGETVLHFDVQLAGRAGALKTDRTWAPALAAAPGVLIRTGGLMFVQAELAGMATYEKQRRSLFAFGLMPSLSAGVRW